MSSADRLRQLRDLAGRLEQLPATEERDRMLRKVRERAVDVDTGDTTRPFLASRPARKRADAAGGRLAEPACEAPSTGWRSRPSRPRPGDPVATLPSNDILVAGELLCLDDVPAAGASSPRTRGAWERGLRG
jgi:hypothetical protein